MAGDDRHDGRVPGHSGVHQAAVGADVSRADEIPAQAQRIGDEGDRELAVDHEMAEVMREVIGQRNRNEREHEPAIHGAGRRDEEHGEPE